MTREEVINQAVDQCLKELYEYAVPKITWEKFVEENKLYNKIYEEWKQYHNAYLYKEKYPEKWESLRKQYETLEWENKSEEECIGPKPFEFYYLPEEIMKDICQSYIDAYRLDSQQELLNTIWILKYYCQHPTVEKYIEKEGEPGYKGYENPDNLEKELDRMIRPYTTEIFGSDFQDKFFEFLDMAGKFFNWNRELNSFNVSIYLGPSPNSNKEAVIKNWKKYKGKDIEINEEQIKKDYYGEDELD